MRLPADLRRWPSGHRRAVVAAVGDIADAYAYVDAAGRGVLPHPRTRYIPYPAAILIVPLVRLCAYGYPNRSARRRHGGRRSAGPDDPPGRDRARPVAAGARRVARTTAPRWSPPTCASARTPIWPRCGSSPRAATSSRSTTSTCRASTSGRSQAEGVKVFPGADALRVRPGQARRCGSGCPRWARRCRAGGRVSSAADIVGLRRGESAGRWSPRPPAAGTTGAASGCSARPATAAELVATGTRLIVEERVPLRRELAALVARSPFGQVAAYPVVETVQRDGICVEVIAPAPGLAEELALDAQQLAIDLATELGVVGLLAVELFETDTGILVNELAMRPHNSGHWTIEGARTSQFEQHLRAVLDYPMGETHADRAGRGDGQRARRPARRHLDRRAAAPPVRRRTRARRCTCTASRSGPAARSATSRCSATTGHGTRPGRARRPLAAGRRVMAPVVGVIMGSDSDWPTMEAAARRAGRVRGAVRGRRRLGAPHGPQDGRLRRRRRPTAACR